MPPPITAGELADEQAEIGDSGGVAFPLRVAAVNIGSNAIRFTAAEFHDPLDFVGLAKAVRLELFGEGSLLLEQWALKKKGRMFKRVFDRKLKPTIAAG